MIQTERVRRGPRIAGALLLLCGSLTLAAHERTLSAGGRTWRLTAEGRLAGEGAPAGLPPLADAAVSPGASILYGLAGAADGKSTDLLGLTVPEGEVATRWTIKGSGRFLAVSRDGDHACVVGVRPGGRPDSAEAWTLSVVALETGQVHGPISLKVIPADVLLIQTPIDDPIDFRLYVASPGRISTFSMHPPNSSWFLSSPGENRRLGGQDGSGVVVALRGDSQLAIFDPAKRPKESGRAVMRDDDATATVALPARGREVALIEGGRIAAVLHDDGAAVTFVDVAAAAVIESRPLVESSRSIDPARLGPLPSLLPPPPPRIAVRREPAPPATVEPAPKVPEPVREVPRRVAEEPEPSAKQEAPPPPAPREEPRTEPEADPEPAQPPAPKAEPKPAPPPVTEPAKRQEPPPKQEPAPSPVTLPEPERESPPAPTEPHAAAAQGLAGRISGEGAAGLVVSLYGPGNILKLRERTLAGPEGGFRFTLPPPGAYRVVVSAPPGSATQVFTAPDFHSIRVDDDTALVTGLDFRIRGRL